MALLPWLPKTPQNAQTPGTCPPHTPLGSWLHAKRFSTFAFASHSCTKIRNRNLDRPAKTRSRENTEQRKHGAACRAACCAERVGGACPRSSTPRCAQPAPPTAPRRPSARVGPAPGQAQRPGRPSARPAGPVAGGVTGRAAHRELGVAQCPLPPLCSPGSLGKSATYMLMLDVGLCCCLAGYVQYAGALGCGWRATDWCWADVTAAASPSAFHGQKGRRKKAPAARSGGTDRRSCRWCVITAAGALRSIICPCCCWPAGC